MTWGDIATNPVRSSNPVVLARLGASRLAEPGGSKSIGETRWEQVDWRNQGQPRPPSRESGIPGKRRLELVHLASAVTRERVRSLVAQESVFPTERLATHAVRLVVLVLRFVMAPKVVLARKAEATQMALNVHGGVNKDTLQ